MIANRRRRGQGMTEYIVLVGLIGILLVAAVTRFKNQIQYTIEGTAGTVDNMNLGSDSPNLDGDPGDGPGGAYEATDRTTADGETIYTNGGTDYVLRNGTYVPVR